MTNPPLSPRDLALQARALCLRQVADALAPLAERLDAFLLELIARPAPQQRRDAWLLLQSQRESWLAGSRGALAALLERFERGQSAPAASADAELALVADETVESQILSARAALAALDQGGSAFNDLRLRLQQLSPAGALDPSDPVHALVVAQALVQAWTESGLERGQWRLCEPLLSQQLGAALADGWRRASDFLLDHGVLPEIDLRALVRRSPSAPAGPASAAGAPAEAGPAAPADASAALLHFLSGRLPAGWQQALTGTAAAGPAIDWSSLEQGLAELRAQVREMKSAARSDQEKALIEVVALIFDSLLTEERIPSRIRVWFARLQLPVLRMALGDADFIASEQHPARQLIDRMGACVLGSGGEPPPPLEAEIRRIVQVVEQYPETGRRVFELTLLEFQAFVAQQLREQGGFERLASAAQQLEQRETLTFGYTIELRRRLDAVAVAGPVRDFLLRTWTDAMAQAAVLYGSDDARALRLRDAVAELLELTSAKPERRQRAQALVRVPALFARLRDGMALLGCAPQRQQAALHAIGDALVDAFMSRVAPLDSAWLAGLTQGLAALEDCLPDAGGEIELSRDSVELIAGVDADRLTVLPDAGPPATAAMRERAAALEPGGWHRFEHEGVVHPVQLVWRSERGQLYLFAAPAGHCWLLQRGRVAASLQAGRLRQHEGLTARATRDALDQLAADPDRLLA